MKNKDYVLQHKKSLVFIIIKIIVIIIIIYIMVGLKNSVKTNNMCFANIIGLDKCNSNQENLDVTFQIINPKMSSSNSISSENAFVTSIEEKSIDLAISKAQDYISSNIDFSHTNAIIISEDLAKEGIQRYISNISNNLNYNTNMYILICETSAKEFIECLNTNKNIDPISYFYILKNSQETSGSVEIINLTKFSDKLFTSYSSPTAPICKVTSLCENSDSNNINNNDDSKRISSSSNEDENNMSDDAKNSSLNLEVGGTAIFKGEKMIGVLSNDETAFHMMLTSKVKSYKTPILNDNEDKEDGSESKNQLTKSNVDITQTSLAKIKVYTKASKPRIDITIPVNITVLDTPAGEYDYLDQNYLDNIKEDVTKTLEKKINNYLDKVQNEFGADIDELYKYSRINFLTSKEYRDYNFEERFKEAKFNVKFDVSFNDPGLNLEK